VRPRSHPRAQGRLPRGGPDDGGCAGRGGPRPVGRSEA
ncbi:MAG: hypothetical protein AVDCRST_MAG79-2358, partial [uncultured Thermoleophilia bacterium]